MAVTLANWNVEWASPRKRDAIRGHIAGWDADILVVTEGDHGVLPPGGTAVDGGTDWGYRVTRPERRKVMLWSRWPLRDVRTGVPAGVRSGRLIDAVVESPAGPLRVVVTAGTEPLRGLSRQELDHIALSPGFAVEDVWGMDRHDGTRLLSDHDAVLARVQ